MPASVSPAVCSVLSARIGPLFLLRMLIPQGGDAITRMLVTLALVFSAGSQAGTPVTLQLHWLHQFEFAGYYAALHKGYFAEEGLDVTILSGGPGISAIARVASGEAEFGVASSELLLARLNGQPVVALAPIFQHSAAVFLTGADSDVRSPQDMIGKRVEMGDLISDAEAWATLRAEGVDTGRISHVPSTFGVQALIEGRSEVISAYITNQPYQLSRRNIPYRIIRPQVYGIDFYGDILFTSEQQLAAQPKQVDAFLRASLRGWQYAFAHSDEIIDLISRGYSSDELQMDPAKLRYERDQMEQLVMPQLIRIGHSNPGRWQHMADTFASIGLVPADYDLSGFLYDTEAATFDWSHPYVRIVILTALGLLLISLVLSYFNRRLHREVARRRLVEGRLSDSEYRLSLALWGANLGCWNWDLQADLVYLDERATAMLGMADGAQEIRPGSGGRIEELFESLREELDEDGEVRAERHVKNSGDTSWVLIRGRRLSSRDDDQARAFGTLMDVSSDHAYQEKLIKLSITDPLTGLLNRRYFFDRLLRSCSQSRRDGNLLTLALLDIDHFKEVNDKYGHLAGDEALVCIAELLLEDGRPYDLVARFGGEEFIILFYGIDKHQAARVLERYREDLRTTQIVAEGHRFYCTFSCGLSDSSEISAAELEPNALVKLADERLYYGKQHGRNQIVLISAA